MARTNAKYFEYAKSLIGEEAAPTPVKILIANSTTIKIGQMVRLNTGGYVTPAGVGNAILGLVSGMIDSGGKPVNSFAYNDPTGHTNSGDDTIVTASDNQTRTVAVYAEVMILAAEALVYNVASAALTQANLLSFFNLVATSDQADQSTASLTAGQLQLIQLDPRNEGLTTTGLFKVAQSQVFGYGSGTWKTA